MNDTTSTTYGIYVTRLQEAYVFIQTDDPAVIGDAAVLDAVAATLDDEDFQTITNDPGNPSGINQWHGPRLIEDKSILKDVEIHDLRTKVPDGNLSARAKEIGIGYRTLQKWKAEGMNVFDDAEVKRHLSFLRVQPRGLTEDFKMKLR